MKCKDCRFGLVCFSHALISKLSYNVYWCLQCEKMLVWHPDHTQRVLYRFDCELRSTDAIMRGTLLYERNSADWRWEKKKELFPCFMIDPAAPIKAHAFKHLSRQARLFVGTYCRLCCAPGDIMDDDAEVKIIDLDTHVLRKR